MDSAKNKEDWRYQQHKQTQDFIRDAKEKGLPVQVTMPDTPAAIAQAKDEAVFLRNPNVATFIRRSLKGEFKGAIQPGEDEPPFVVVGRAIPEPVRIRVAISNILPTLVAKAIGAVRNAPGELGPVRGGLDAGWINDEWQATDPAPRREIKNLTWWPPAKASEAK